MTRGPRPSTLEVVLRIRAPSGTVQAEYIIRGARVELTSYHPNGTHAVPPVIVSLEHFVEEITKRRST